MRECRFCQATLASKADDFCHHCGIIAPAPDRAREFYGWLMLRHVASYALWILALGLLLHFLAHLPWLGFLALAVVSPLIGYLLERPHMARLDVEQQVLAFHRITPHAWHMSGNDVARSITSFMRPARIAHIVDTMQKRESVCDGTDPTDPRRS